MTVLYIFYIIFCSVDVVFVCVMKQEVGILLYSTVEFLLNVNYKLKSIWQNLCWEANSNRALIRIPCLQETTRPRPTYGEWL